MLFKDIASGTEFIIEGEKYIKLETNYLISIPSIYGYVNAVQCRTGKLVHFTGSTEIELNG